LRSYLNAKSSGSRSRKQRLTAVGTRCADHVTPLYPQKLARTSPTCGGRSVGIVRVRTKATEFVNMYFVGCIFLNGVTGFVSHQHETVAKSADQPWSWKRGPRSRLSMSGGPQADNPLTDVRFVLSPSAPGGWCAVCSDTLPSNITSPSIPPYTSPRCINPLSFVQSHYKTLVTYGGL